MKIIYVHHAERDKKKKDVTSQEQDITENGIKQAELVAESFKGYANVKAIYTSPYIRCMHTATIINKYIKVPIYEEPKFNEMDFDGNEKWVDFQQRNMNAIDNILNKYSEEDIVICVSSGVNITAFICHAMEINANNENRFCQAGLCSPVTFHYNDK